MIALDRDEQILSVRRRPAPDARRVATARRRRRAGARHADGQLALGDEVAVDENAGALDHVAQLADVAFPRAPPASSRSAPGVRPEHRLLQALARLAHERGGQIRNVLAPIAQRRQLHLDDVEAVVEVAAEAAGGRLRRADRGWSRRSRARRPAARRATRRAAPRRARARAAASPARDGGSSPISSRKSVPPSASSNRPGLLSVAPVNAPRTWPNSSLSNSVSTTAEQLTVTKRRSRRGPDLMQRARDELLAGAGLAGDERGAHVRRQPANHAEQLLHHRAAADHAAELEPLGDVALDRQHAAPPLDLLADRRRAAARAARSRAACSGSPSRRA